VANGASSHKDAVFQCYAALFEAGLLNDHLLPLIHDWSDGLEQPVDLPSKINAEAQMKPLRLLAKAWSSPDLHQVCTGRNGLHSTDVDEGLLGICCLIDIFRAEPVNTTV